MVAYYKVTVWPYREIGSEVMIELDEERIEDMRTPEQPTWQVASLNGCRCFRR